MLEVAKSLSNQSDEVLLSAIIPSSTVRELLAEYGSVRRAIMNAYPDELQSIRGIGPIKARQLKYICELARRMCLPDEEKMKKIRSPQDVINNLAELQYLHQEEFRVVFLNTKNDIVAKRMISRGTINSAVLGPREVFHRAVKLMAAAIILVHNHPSGDPNPSREDIELTKNMVQAGNIMGIAVLDHVIIGNSSYVSFKDKGLMQV